jgi:inner membrane protein
VPSSLSHAMVAVATGSVVAPRRLLWPFLVVGAACAVLPDIDAVGRPFYHAAGDVQALGGHRAFTHSITFAALLGLLVAAVTFVGSEWRGYRVRLMIFVAFVTASHGILDLFTSIGASTSPVHFFSPFSSRGYTAAWHPIDGPFSELFLCLLPLVGFTYTVWCVRGIPWPRRKPKRPVNLGLAKFEGPPNEPLQPTSGAGEPS